MEPSRAVLRGRFGSTPWEHEVSLHRGADGAGLAAHWARARITALLDQRRSGAPDDAICRAVIDVALTHHLISPYTSLVGVDVTPARPGDAGLHTHALKTNLPAGWDYDAVFGLGQGATAGPLHIVLGLCVLLLAAALHVGLRRDVAFALPRRGRHGT